MNFQSVNGHWQPWYVDVRLNALARVHLTRSARIRIEPASRATLLDYIAEIMHDGEATNRQFGVRVLPLGDKSTVDPTKDDYDQRLPVCTLWFNVVTEEAEYAWTNEPVIPSRKEPKLLRRASSDRKVLNRRSLDQIIAKVNRWYEAMNAYQSPAASAS